MLSAGEIVASGRPDEVLTPDLVGDVFGVGAVRTVHPVTGKPQLAFYPPAGGRSPSSPRVAARRTG